MITANFMIYGRSYGVTYPIQPEYQAVLDRATALGYTLPDWEQQRLDNNKVYYLKLLNLWDEIDVLYLFNRSSSQANFSKLNFKNPLLHQLTSPTPPTFVDGTGWIGGGGSYWLSYTPSLHAVKALPSNVSVFYHHFGFSNAASAVWGTRNGSSNNFSHGNASCSLHAGSIPGTGGYNLNTDLLQVKNGTTHNKYVNGVLTTNATYTSGGALSTHPLALLGYNLNGTVGNFITLSGLKYFGMGSKNLELHQLELYKIINNTYE